MDFVQTLPTHISKQILAGIEYTKKKMRTDLKYADISLSSAANPLYSPQGSHPRANAGFDRRIGTPDHG